MNRKKIIPAADKKISVTGVGNAIMDVIATVDDGFLSDLKIDKGSMKLICEQEAEDLSSKLEIKALTSGGSAANTIAGLAFLGNRTAFIGKVKNDRFGLEFEKDLKKLGVLYKTPKAEGECPSTACCIVLTTPDSQRTMNTFLGVSCMLSEKDIDEEIISSSAIIYLEGYLLDQQTARKAVRKTLKLAKKYNAVTALSLSDTFCVSRNIRFLRDILFGNHIDLCFGNESEINELCGTGAAGDSIQKLKKYNFISVITMGESGSTVIENGIDIHIKAEKVFSLDSTGAGDMYAAGFLHGLIQKKDLYSCARIGSVVAAQIVSQYGARPEKSLLELLSERGLK